jgi:protein-L-isoaspartate(D-aspartate) O-methyltransferase
MGKNTRSTFHYDRDEFVRWLRRRGINDAKVLKAMREVPRENFVGMDLAEFAYDDTPLPIEEGQTISQPYIVALMTEALGLKPTDSVLEIGTGSGYAAAVLSRMVDSVYTIERHRSLAHQAAGRLDKLGYNNVRVMVGDGTLGWPEHAPYDAIVVTAGGPEAPRTLVEQLAIGGRMVIPAGPSLSEQKLLRITRVSDVELEIEELGAVRFVPLIGAEGWREAEDAISPDRRREQVHRPEPLAEQIERAATHFADIENANLAGLMERIGNARVVLLGEATHGTAEFYDMRARITRELIQQKGLRFIAVEADWPDAAQIDHFVRGTRLEPTEETTFSRFPTWMWANRQVLELAKWLRDYNQRFTSPDDAVGFYGMDLYSLYASIDSVIRYLEDVDEEAAAVARQRYGCLSPWQKDPATYGAMTVRGQFESCEKEVVAILDAMLANRLEYAKADGRRFLDAVSNARLVRNAEEYYRVMYQGSVKSWNLRDTHMFETLKALLDFHGTESRCVVWAHNSHLGDASATEIGARGEFNVGQLCRKTFSNEAYLVGFGTHEGTVAAASDWGAPMEIKQVRPSHQDSYERLCHDAGLNTFLLPLRDRLQRHVRALMTPRLERAIGVIYRPETELASHYFQACLPLQFDEYIWFDRTSAVDALGPEAGAGVPETFPFGL